MRSSHSKHLFAAACLLTFAGSAAAKSPQEAAEKPRIVIFPARGVERGSAAPGQHLLAKVTNLADHGGPKIIWAKVVLLFVCQA